MRLMKAVAGLLLLSLAAAVVGCGPGAGTAGANAGLRPTPAATLSTAATAPPVAAETAPVYGFEVVNTWPHDALAFTQELEDRLPY